MPCGAVGESLVKRSLDKAEGSLFDRRQRDANAVGNVESMLGESPCIQVLKAEIKQLQAVENSVPERAQAPVLITGETGTGKELVARALHFSGPRMDQPFIELNCASLPHHLVEAELFGYERGAFTDAKHQKIGLIEVADGGTLFLDEIGELDLHLQAKLLTVLESYTLRRVGDIRERSVNVRFIAATNRPLEGMVKTGRFRSDLYFRLRIVQFHVPPLRTRGRDILLLAKHYLTQIAAKYRRPEIKLSPCAERVLLGHSWPGNVRELKNAIEQAILLTEGDLIDPSRLALSPLQGMPGHMEHTTAFELPAGGVNLEEIERSFVHQALERTNWNVSASARLLQISRDTLRYRIDKYKLYKQC